MLRGELTESFLLRRTKGGPGCICARQKGSAARAAAKIWLKGAIAESQMTMNRGI